MPSQKIESAKQGRPWLWIVATFVVMIAFWATIVTIAFKNLPQDVPLEHGNTTARAHY